MTTVRLDTLRNQLAATIDLLHMVGQELDDLHVLAYERATAATEAKVSGGTPDYALDTHGDPKARDAYRRLGEVTSEACRDLAQTSHEALSLLRTGPSPGRGGRRIQLAALGDALDAQARRIARGEYTPIRRGPQPDRDQVLEQTRRERDAANQRVAKLQKKLDRLRARTAS